MLAEAVERPVTTPASLAPAVDISTPRMGLESPAEALFRSVQRLVLPMLEEPKTQTELADLLDVTEGQIREWLQRMVERGLASRDSHDACYSAVHQSDSAATGS